jgi:hypothetical protein
MHKDNVHVLIERMRVFVKPHMINLSKNQSKKEKEWVLSIIFV